MTIDIIGAGIGGLTTAIALKQKGIKTRIFEQTEKIKPAGAGIILANNAMQVYEKLGLKTEITAYGNPISCMHITNANLQPFSSVDLKYFENKYQVQTIAIHRGKLQEILLSQMDKDNIKLGYKLFNVSRDNSEYVLKFKNGKTITTQNLLGADGLNSVVRNSLFSENKVRNAYQICWRGVTEFQLSKKYQHELNEAWGKGDRFGFVQIAPQKVYWYALKTYRPDHLQFSREGLPEYFKSYHSIIKEIICSTPIDKIYTSNILDLSPIKKWYGEHVCLLGDAAHAATPNMGQGACQAIEDAYVLSACLQKYELNKAFCEYQRLRMPKAHQVVNTSWAVGKLAHWKNPLAISFRNMLMTLTPNSLSRKQSEKIFRLATI